MDEKKNVLLDDFVLLEEDQSKDLVINFQSVAGEDKGIIQCPNDNISNNNSTKSNKNWKDKHPPNHESFTPPHF